MSILWRLLFRECDRSVFLCVCGHHSLCWVWLLLEDVVDQDLKEDQKHDDDVVALLEEGGALRPAGCTAPQHADAPVYVLLRLLYRFNGTLKFTEVCSFFPQPTVMLAFVSLAARRVLAVGFR